MEFRKRPLTPRARTRTVAERKAEANEIRREVTQMRMNPHREKYPGECSVEEFQKLCDEALIHIKSEVKKSNSRRLDYLIDLFKDYSQMMTEEMDLSLELTEPITEETIRKVTEFAKGYDDDFIVESKDG